MNIPFPKLTPSLLDPSWFNPDSAVDEDAELTALEREHQAWLDSKVPPGRQTKVQKPRPTPMEEANTNVEVAISSTVNNEPDESEETHDEDEETHDEGEETHDEDEETTHDEDEETHDEDEETTHDEDEDEIVPSYSPDGNNEDAEQEEDTSDAETVDQGNQSGLWLVLPP